MLVSWQEVFSFGIGDSKHHHRNHHRRFSTEVFLYFFFVLFLGCPRAVFLDADNGFIGRGFLLWVFKSAISS
jgi:hypothetical protein